MIVEVVINRAAQEINRTFDYLIPSKLDNLVEVGCRVFVPLGRSQEIGYVTKIKDESSYDLSKLKEIIDLIDDVPLLNEMNIDLAYNISRHYFTSFGKSLELMIPQGLRKAVSKNLIVVDYNKLPNSLKPIFTDSEITYTKQLKDYQEDIIKAIKDNAIEEKFIFKDKGSIKLVKYYKYNNNLHVVSPKAKELINYLKEINEDVTKDDLLNLGYSESSLRTLVKNNNVLEYSIEDYRNIKVSKILKEKVVLNTEQENVYNTILKSLNSFDKFLIHGVCGSGKTEIYLNLIEDVLKSGKNAIMLVPEISLTPQMASRFKNRFNDEIAIIHSGLSTNEKYDEYRRIKKGLARIVLGVRSAIFSPLNNVGIIIMDEEQEKSYIQDSTPCYDTHYVASYLAKYYNCPLVLGSATPKVSTYYQALQGEYKLLNLYKRANNRPLEKSIVVDLRDEIKKGNRTVFSNVLRQELKNNLAKSEQSILFINRRAYATSCVCRSCGEVIKCPNCDVSLVYHKSDNTLRCHYCNYQIKKPTNCPNCNSTWIREMGAGTEKVEEELKNSFPEARVLRMDQDTVSQKNKYSEFIDLINDHKKDIVLGTQIVAKGLDFPLVSLVGVINADLSLFISSYDAYEKTYDLIEQVSGRAGRKDTKGICIIQTYNPDNYAIEAASKHSYLDFYKKEIKSRELSKNPPFADLIEIMCESSDHEVLYQEAYKIKRLLENNPNFKVLGPVAHVIYKLNNKYRVVITVKAIRNCDLSLINEISDRYLSLNNIKLYIRRM